MRPIQIIVGSMLGGTEYVAEACEETLNELQFKTEISLKPNFDEIIKNTFNDNRIQEKLDNSTKNPLWIFCTSTHGAGEFPDNIKTFINDLKHCEQDLSTLNFITIGLGDSNYDTFCKAAIDISNLLISLGCNQLTPIKTFDMSKDIDPEDLVQQWIKENKDLLDRYNV
jgi:MioC protein